MHIKTNRTLFLLSGTFFFNLCGMEAVPLIEEAQSHVEIFFDCHPIIQIAVHEEDEGFNGNLYEVRASLANRTEFNVIEENVAFLSALRESIARQREASMRLLRQQHYEDYYGSRFERRMSELEKVLADFEASIAIQQSANYDSPLPIFQGLELKAPPVSHATSTESSFAKTVRSTLPIIIGGLIILLPAFIFRN